MEATNYAIDLAANPNFKIDADGSALAGLRDGSVKAMFTGSWDAKCDQKKHLEIIWECHLYQLIQ